MTLIQRFSLWLSTRAVERRMQRVPSRRAPGDTHSECAQLALQIADDAARCDVESYCTKFQLRWRVWYDTEVLRPEGIEVEQGVERAVRYLDLRGALQRHPQQAHLVRFAR